MELPRPKFLDSSTQTESEILTLEEYKIKIGSPKIPTSTIHYNMKKNNIDFIIIGRYHHIIFNEKAQKFKPGKNYGKRWKNKAE